MKHFKAIAAMAQNRVIGQGNKIPWHLPEDFAWFKKTTTGHVLVMGRKTFDSIGKPLPNRETIVLSRTGFAHPGVRVVTSLAEIDPNREKGEVFICGGSQIYEQTLPLCSELLLTRLKKTAEGDIFFPAFENDFILIEKIKDCADFEILRYQNRRLLGS